MIQDVFHNAVASILEEAGFDPQIENFADMGMDSLDYVAFITEIEESFSVSVPKGLTFEGLKELQNWMVRG